MVVFQISFAYRSAFRVWFDFGIGGRAGGTRRHTASKTASLGCHRLGRYIDAGAVSDLAGRLPDLQVTATETVGRLRLFLERVASHAPQGVRPLVDRSVARLFTSGTALMEQAAVRLPKAISAVLSWVPDGALGVGTGILSGFMLSARLPKLKPAIARRVPEELRTKLLPVLRRSKEALWGWVRAQLKLTAITYGIVTVGFLLLRVPFAPLWAAGVALVDAVPLLGTGTVLLPWALVSLVQREHLRSIGLLCIYGTTFFTRTVLEPRLVGRQLGIDPLVTLIFLYLGYKFWGLFGMLVAPMLVVAITAVGREKRHRRSAAGGPWLRPHLSQRDPLHTGPFR